MPSVGDSCQEVSEFELAREDLSWTFCHCTPTSENLSVHRLNWYFHKAVLLQLRLSVSESIQSGLVNLT